MSLVTRGLGSPALVTRGYGSTGNLHVFYNRVFDRIFATDSVVSEKEGSSRATDLVVFSDRVVSTREIFFQVFDSATVSDSAQSFREYLSEALSEIVYSDAALSEEELVAAVFDQARISDSALAALVLLARVFDVAETSDGTWSETSHIGVPVPTPPPPPVSGWAEMEELVRELTKGGAAVVTDPIPKRLEGGASAQIQARPAPSAAGVARAAKVLRRVAGLAVMPSPQVLKSSPAGAARSDQPPSPLRGTSSAPEAVHDVAGPAGSVSPSMKKAAPVGAANPGTSASRPLPFAAGQADVTDSTPSQPTGSAEEES